MFISSKLTSRTDLVQYLVLTIFVSSLVFDIFAYYGGHTPGTFIKYAFADPIQNARTERIGNYDFQMTTEPKDPVQGAPVKIVLRVATVDGSDLVDVPVVIRIADGDGKLLEATNPIVLPAGHYTYTFTFDTPGRKTVYFDLTDNAFTGQKLTFTFFINVASPYDFLYIAIPSVAAVVAFLAILRFIRKRRLSLRGANASA